MTEDLATLLTDPAPEELSAWLATAARNLSGYQPQPSVLRRSRRAEGEHLEVRRWSPESFLAVGQNLLLSPEGELFELRLEGKRHLRRRADESIDDEIYAFERLEQPGAAALEQVRARCVAELREEGYRHWGRLSPAQQERLAGYGGTPEEAAWALQQGGVAAFQLFMSNPSFRDALLDAGAELPLSVQLVPWLVTRPEWNLQPQLVRMARAAVARDPDGAWELRSHPNPAVRLRLVDLLAEHQGLDWVAWLAEEGEPAVRDRLRHTLQQALAPARLVDRLLDERDPARREALGWMLVHWKGDLSQQDLNRALKSSLGRENKTRLKRRLELCT